MSVRENTYECAEDTQAIYKRDGVPEIQNVANQHHRTPHTIPNSMRDDFHPHQDDPRKLQISIIKQPIEKDRRAKPQCVGWKRPVNRDIA